MYSLVLLTAMSAAPEAPSFGARESNFWVKHCFFESCWPAKYGWTCGPGLGGYYPGPLCGCQGDGGHYLGRYVSCFRVTSCGGCYGCYGGSYGSCHGSCYGSCYGGCTGCSGSCHGCSGYYGTSYGYYGGYALGGCYSAGYNCYGCIGTGVPSYSSVMSTPSTLPIYTDPVYGTPITGGTVLPATVTPTPAPRTLQGGTIVPLTPDSGTPLIPSIAPPSKAPSDATPLIPPLPGSTSNPTLTDRTPIATVASFSKKPSDQATIIVRVPADARVYVDETPMKINSTEGVFISPALADSGEYYYTIRVAVERDGKYTELSKKAMVKAGDTTRLTFDELFEKSPSVASK